MENRAVWLAAVLLVGFVGVGPSHAQDESGNYFLNGGFEDGVLDPWGVYGGATAEVVSELVGAAINEDPIEGNVCLHVKVTPAGANWWEVGLVPSGAVFEQGKKYTVSAFLKCKEGTFQVDFKPQKTADPWTGYGQETFTITEEWTEYSVTTPVFAENVTPAGVTFHIGFAAGEFWIDGVRFYEGDYVPTPTGPQPKAHDPQPENRAKNVPVTGTILSWKTGLDPNDPNVPNPAITGHYLWLSIAHDPANPPATPDWQEPIPIPSDTSPADGSVDPTASYSPAGLQRDALYYWIVDESLGAADPRDWDNIIVGAVWSFETVTSGPEVDAGSSIVTSLKEGTATVDLNGTVTDATGDVTAIAWSAVVSPSSATVDIANTSVAATTATLTETGRYVLELRAVDAAQHEDSDLMEINVYGDSCEAAKNDPNGYLAPQYDFNDDCRVDFIDFAMFAAAWLEDASLTEDALYEPDTIFLPPVVTFTNPLNGSTVSGEVIINAIAYDPTVGTTDGDGMLGAGSVFFEVIDSLGTVLDTQNENQATFDMTWNTALPLYPNGVYTTRVTATSDAGYVTTLEISVTVNNP